MHCHMHVCAFLGVEEPWSLSHLRYTEWLQRPAIVGDLGSVETEKQGITFALTFAVVDCPRQG